MALWRCVATCRTCGKVLNTAEHVPEGKKTEIIISAPLMAICKEPGHSTYSDCNIGVVLTWSEEAE